MSERFRTLVQRFTCGVDVVNNDHSLESITYPQTVLAQRESMMDVGRARGPVEPALAGAVAHAAEQRSIGEPGVPCKPPGERLGEVEAAVEPVVAVGRAREVTTAPAPARAATAANAGAARAARSSVSERSARNLQAVTRARAGPS